MQSTHDEPHAGDDERDAEQLTHVEHHALLKIFLHVFDELDEEAAAEDEREEATQKESGTSASIETLVEPRVDKEYGQVA